MAVRHATHKPMSLRSATAWATSSFIGTCDITDESPASCSRNSKGSWRLEGNQSSSWVLAAAACLKRCQLCERCRYISIGLWASDCSWFESCSAPTTKMTGFRSGAVSNDDAPHLHRLPTLTPVLPHRTGRAALQLSGHLFDCNLHDLHAHLRACRTRFDVCDVFVHTWSKLAPGTVHWTGTHRAHSKESSHACVSRISRELAPHANIQVEEQPLPPPEEALAPDGRPFRTTALAWGASRYHGWMMNVR